MGKMSPNGGAQSMINKAAARTQAGTEPPKTKPRKPSVGNETKADMTGALHGGPTNQGLKGAVAELHSQHPHRHDDLGPHHNDSSHMRHKPMKLA